MMNAAFAELAMDWHYVHLPIAPARFAQTTRALPASGYRGANVTIPHKLAAHDLADERSPAARAIGAVNTLVFEPGGAIFGDNTDAGGLIDAVGESERARAQGARARSGRRRPRGGLGAARGGRRGRPLEPHTRAGRSSWPASSAYARSTRPSPRTSW